jgi:hypothetical protein
LKVMILGAIGTAIGAAGNIASGIMSAVNNKKMRNLKEAENARIQAYYEAKANEDPLSKASNQRLLKQYDREAKEQVERARNVAAITGATPEYSLAVQKNIAEGKADLMGDIAASHESVEEKALENLESARQQAAKDELTRLEQRNQTFANLAANAGTLAGGMIGGIGAIGAGKSTTDASTPSAADASSNSKAATSNAATSGSYIDWDFEKPYNEAMKNGKR